MSNYPIPAPTDTSKPRSVNRRSRSLAGGTFVAVLVLLTACGSDGAGPSLDPMPQIETRPIPSREDNPNITLDRASKVAIQPLARKIR